MITFRQVRNATVKLEYSGVTSMVDPWLADACAPEERDRALATRSFIPKPICPLPAPAKDLVAGVDFFLLTHFHPDHFSADHLPADAPLFCQNETDARYLEGMDFANVRHFEGEALRLGGVTIDRFEPDVDWQPLFGHNREGLLPELNRAHVA